MTAVDSVQGFAAALEAYVRLAAHVRLFANDHTPSNRDTEGNYREVQGHGYAAKALPTDGWSRAVGSPLTCTYPVVVFTFTGPARKMYGYYVTAFGGRLLWAERFPEPTRDRPEDYIVVNPGDHIDVVLSRSVRS